MIEIQPISPSFPLVKPRKIDKDEQRRPEKQPQRKKPETDEPNSEPVQHIDEIV